MLMSKCPINSVLWCSSLTPLFLELKILNIENGEGLQFRMRREARVGALMKRGDEEIDHPDTCDCDCPTIECCAVLQQLNWIITWIFWFKVWRKSKKALLKVVERQRFALRSHIKGGLAKDLDLDHPVGCDSVSYCRQGIVMNRKVRCEG